MRFAPTAIVLALITTNCLADEVCIKDKLPPNFSLDGSLTYLREDADVKLDVELASSQSGLAVVGVDFVYDLRHPIGKIDINDLDGLPFRIPMHLYRDNDESLVTTFYVPNTYSNFALILHLVAPRSLSGLPHCGMYYAVNVLRGSMRRAEGELPLL